MAVFEEARRNNWGYVPLTRAEILETAHELRRVIDPEIVLIAEVQGRPAGRCWRSPTSTFRWPPCAAGCIRLVLSGSSVNFGAFTRCASSASPPSNAPRQRHHRRAHGRNDHPRPAARLPPGGSLLGPRRQPDVQPLHPGCRRSHLVQEVPHLREAPVTPASGRSPTTAPTLPPWCCLIGRSPRPSQLPRGIHRDPASRSAFFSVWRKTCGCQHFWTQIGEVMLAPLGDRRCRSNIQPLLLAGQILGEDVDVLCVETHPLDVVVGNDRGFRIPVARGIKIHNAHRTVGSTR